MIISKILNNNVVISTNSAGAETILMGRGLAFKKKVGDAVDPRFIQKEFVLKDSMEIQQIKQLFIDIPSEEIEVAKKIIEMSEEKLQTSLSPNIYLTLTDHLHYAIQRYKEGIAIPNLLLLETQKFYPEQYQVAQKGLEIIAQELGINLPESEAGFITFHIVNSQTDNGNMQTTMQVTEIVRDALLLISRYFGRTFDVQSLNYQRLVTHLQYFVQRYVQDKLSGEADEFLYALVQAKYPKSFQAVLRLNEFLEKKYQKAIGQSETIYLTIHIEHVVNEHSID